VTMVLSKEPANVQRAAVVVVAVLKAMAKGLATSSNENSKGKNEA